MKKTTLFITLLFTMYITAQNPDRPQPESWNIAAIEKVTQIFSFDAAISVLNIPTDLCSLTITPTLRITNAGSTQLTSATITHQLDTDTPVVINWTGSLAMDAFEDIPLTALAVSGIGGHLFTASVANPNGETDESPTNDSNTQNFTRPVSFATSTIKVIVTPDRYGGETTWQITNSTGTVIGSGGPYITTGTNSAQPDEIVDVTISVTDECYTFTLNDSYGDGICCLYGDGTYRLEDGVGNILVNGSGDFGGTISNLFNVTDPTLNVDNNELVESIKIYPNPFSSEFTVNINDSSSNLIYEITNMIGQKISNGSLQIGSNLISMDNQAAGFYFIKISNNDTNESTVKKMIKY